MPGSPLETFSRDGHNLISVLNGVLWPPWTEDRFCVCASVQACWGMDEATEVQKQKGQLGDD